uniref:Uncharacterized protein n=1 Tax=uncultured bacterium F41-01 TaxID=1191437 RepID=I3VIP0_9BACT|nr:hypothetical protein [uncultured bacterium F41-01]
MAHDGFGTIGGEDQPRGGGRAARGGDKLFDRLCGQRLRDSPVPGRRDPYAAQGAEGIFVTLRNQPQVLCQSLRKGPLALRRIQAGGREGRCCCFPPSLRRTHGVDREPSAARLRYLPGIIAEVEGSLGVGPLVELRGGWGGTLHREARHQDEDADLSARRSELRVR